MDAEAPKPDFAHAPAPGSALFRARGVGVRRGGDWLIRGIDLTIDPGEIVTLIGPNGSGKSTTAKVVLGLIRPDAGKIERAAKVRVGYVPQRLSIDETLPFSVKRLMTMTGPAPEADIRAALARVGIGHLADAAVQRLSGGEFQRALMARAILRKPDLLVLDEPVQGVDFAGEVALYELIRDIRNELGCAILLISHDLHFVMAETDRVLCLNQHVCCAGTPQSVAADPEYRRLFGPRAVEALAVDLVALLILGNPLLERGLDQVEHPAGVAAHVRRALGQPVGQNDQVACVDRVAFAAGAGHIGRPVVASGRPAFRDGGGDLHLVGLAAAVGLDLHRRRAAQHVAQHPALGGRVLGHVTRPGDRIAGV